MIRITILVENSVHQRGLRAEHGLAFHLQVGERSLLFDTGPSNLLLENACHLQIPLERLEAVLLSHGHYDHTGGLPEVWAKTPKAKVFAHPGVLQSRYVREPNGGFRSLGLPAASRECLSKTELVPTHGVTEIIPGVFATGEIPRETDYEDVGGAFFLNQEGTRPDPIIDDQALFFEAAGRTVVLLGCAHSGIVNTLRYVQRITDGRAFSTVMGGMHLLNADRKRLEATTNALREFGIGQIAPGHCTGANATAQLWSAFPGQCAQCSVGKVFEFA